MHNHTSQELLAILDKAILDGTAFESGKVNTKMEHARMCGATAGVMTMPST